MMCKSLNEMLDVVTVMAFIIWATKQPLCPAVDQVFEILLFLCIPNLKKYVLKGRSRFPFV